jgi:hypothetical protein
MRVGWRQASGSKSPFVNSFALFPDGAWQLAESSCMLRGRILDHLTMDTLGTAYIGLWYLYLVYH